MSDDVVYTSNIRIERGKDIRRAYLPYEEQPVLFGMHSEIAEQYKKDMIGKEPHAATIDYLVAATAG
jgi:hypothetical protein